MYICGIVYKIVYKYNTNIVYIGSTFKTLQKRLQKHKLQYKYYKSGIYKSHYRIYDYFDKYGTNDFLNLCITIKFFTIFRSICMWFICDNKIMNII